MARKIKTQNEATAQYEVGGTIRIGNYDAEIVEVRHGFKNGRVELHCRLPKAAGGRLMWWHV